MKRKRWLVKRRSQSFLWRSWKVWSFSNRSWRCCGLIWCPAVITGEEDEETLYQVRGKLFSLGSQNQWKERGTGTIKLNVRRYDGNGARLGSFPSNLILRFVIELYLLPR
jgi:RanBP1 domain